MYDTIPAFLATALGSDIFAGGLVLGALGAALGCAGLVARTLWHLLVRRWVTEVTIDNRSDAWPGLLAWLQESGVLAHVRQVRLTDPGRGGPPVMAPAPGRHWFRHGGRFCRLERGLNERARVGNDRGGSQRPVETATVTIPFGRVAQVQGWLQQGAAILAARERRGPGLHVLQGDWWQSLGELPPRGLDTVICDDDRLLRLADDLRHFLGARDWYQARGVPWRRGYLLYGPPGTGKSSVLRALASELRLDLALIDLSRTNLSDDSLREALFEAPKRAILAMEDIDAVFSGREAGPEAKRGGISFSGLLNALDGVAAQEGRAVVMTTNHPERLDPALIRPGRIDLRVELGPIGAEAAARLYRRFFPGDEAGAVAFALEIGGQSRTAAEVQALLLERAARGTRAVPSALHLAAE